MERMWFNQPSTLQPQHKLHGTNVLVDRNANGGPRAYFLSGPVHSMDVCLIWLSKGWVTPTAKV